MRLNRLQAVLFDHDGTLVDSEGLHCLHWQMILSDHGVQLSEADYKKHLAGIPTPANADRLVSQHGLGVTAQSLSESKEQVTRDHLSKNAFPLMPGAIHALRSVHQAGLKVGIVTGAGSHGVTSTIEAHGLRQLVETVVSGDDVQHSKPAPDCYLLAIERLNLTAADCLALEDTQNGVSAAAAAGLICCAIPNAFSAHHNFEQAHQQFANLSDAISWVKTQQLVSTDQ